MLGKETCPSQPHQHVLGGFLRFLSCALLLVFSGLKCNIPVSQSPKYTRFKRITNQLHLCTLLSNPYIYCCHACFLLVANHTDDIDRPIYQLSKVNQLGVTVRSNSTLRFVVVKKYIFSVIFNC